MEKSSIMETVVSEKPNTDFNLKINNNEITTGGEGSSYTFLLAVIVICLVLFLMYHAYSCFCTNQDTEPYINKQPRTDPQDDHPFDVDDEVKKLIQMQE